MGLIEFVQSAGARVLGLSDDLEAAATAEADAAETMGQALASHVAAQGLSIRDLQVTFKNGSAALFGVAASAEECEKAVVAAGNVKGVASVQNWMTIEPPPVEPENFYTVQPGDTLSGIAKTQYGNAMEYPVIFEANKPMLSDPDKIYPGQVLRIPKLDNA